MSVVVVTGADAGYGLRASLVFARQGHTVFAAVADPSEARPLAGAVEREGLDLRTLCVDLSRGASVEAMVGEVVGAAGAIDILVNTATVELRGPLEETSDADALRQFETNVFGLLRVVRAVLPVMRRQGAGVIVNVSGVAGVVARPFGGVYSATKHAVEAISEALHLEAKPFGVRVAIIEPGQFDTEQAANVEETEGFGDESPYREASSAFDTALRRLLPDERPADPDAVADLIVQVAEDDSAPLRHIAGTDAELIMSVRRAGDFESYEQTMRAALDWWA